MPIKTIFRRGIRYPRLGVIRLGVKVLKTGGKAEQPNDWIPKEVDYFVVPEELQAVLPEHPTEIEVSFPADEAEQVFDYWFTRYDGPLLAIRCDGETCTAIDKGGAVSTGPCRKPDEGACECKAKALGRLNIIVRKAKTFGCYQLVIGGEGRVASMLSELKMCQRAVGGLSRAWFSLVRVAETVQIRKADGSRMARQGHPVHLRLPYSADLLLGAMLPPGAAGAIGQPAGSVAPSVIEHGAVAASPDEGEDEGAAVSEGRTDDLWTLFLDAAGGSPERALTLFRKAAKVNLQRTVESLADLADEEVAKLSEIMARG